jgi:hypothetical protein
MHSARRRSELAEHHPLRTPRVLLPREDQASPRRIQVGQDARKLALSVNWHACHRPRSRSWLRYGYPPQCGPRPHRDIGPDLGPNPSWDPITTTRTAASAPNSSRIRLGNSVATSIPVKPHSTTATGLRAGESGRFASAAKWLSSATASSIRSTENA